MRVRAVAAFVVIAALTQMGSAAVGLPAEATAPLRTQPEAATLLVAAGPGWALSRSSTGINRWTPDAGWRPVDLPPCVDFQNCGWRPFESGALTWDAAGRWARVDGASGAVATGQAAGSITGGGAHGLVLRDETGEWYVPDVGNPIRLPDTIRIAYRVDDAGLVAGQTTGPDVYVSLVDGSVSTLTLSEGLVDLTPTYVVWLAWEGGSRPTVIVHRKHRLTGQDQTVDLGGMTTFKSLAATDSLTLLSRAGKPALLLGQTSVELTAPSQVTSVVRSGAGFAAGLGWPSGLADVTTDGVLSVLAPGGSDPIPARAGLAGGQVVGHEADLASSYRWWARTDGVTLGPVVSPTPDLNGRLGATGQWAVGVSDHLVLWKQGRKVAERWGIDAGAAPSVSGPYVLAKTGDGWSVMARNLATRAALPVGADAFGIFGPRVYYQQDGWLVVRDVTRPVSSTNPRRLRFCPTCRGAGAWGDQYAWTDQGALYIGRLGTSAVSSLPLVTADPAFDVAQARLDSDGVAVVSLSHRADLNVPKGVALAAWDLGTGHLPVQVGGFTPDPLDEPGLHPSDNGRIAWTDRGAAHVGALPFGGRSSPRTLGTWAPAAAAPGTPGAASAWVLEADLTKDLATSTLSIWSGSRRVRTLAGGLTTNQVAVERWDGRDDAGRLVPDGLYAWRLAGQAADGTGLLADYDGVSVPHGTVYVARRMPVARMTNPVFASSASTSASVPVTWTSTTAPGTRAIAYDVQVRSVTVLSGKRVYSSLRTFATATPETVRTFTAAPGTTWQFRVRVHDSLGRTSAWSSLATLIAPRDDRSLAAIGTWYLWTTPNDWLGTYRLSLWGGHKLTGSGYATRLAVIGGGPMLVYVDGRKVATVPATAGRSARTVVWQAVVPFARHTVTVVSTPTSYASTAVDAVAFGL